MTQRKKEAHFTTEDPWRVFRIMAEFVEGFEDLSKVGPAVTVFGSARTKPTNRYYKLAESIGYKIAKAGYAVITGAGPGIMEAANKGAKRARGKSIGLNIEVPVVQAPNPYVTQLLSFTYFFCRKVMFVKYAKAAIILPGGYGTMDEFFEAITLIQTQRIDPFPVILVGRDYWSGLVEFMEKKMLSAKRIDKKDLSLFKITDSPDKVLSYIKQYHAGRKHRY